MAVRNSRPRSAPKTHVFEKVNGVSVMFTWDTAGFMPKSRVYSLIGRVRRGTVKVEKGKTLVHLREDGSIHQGLIGQDLSTKGVLRNLFSKTA